MFIVADEVDGNFYVDLVLSPTELKRVKQNEMVSGQMILRRRKYYLGIRLQGNWDYYGEDDVEGEEKD